VGKYVQVKYKLSIARILIRPATLAISILERTFSDFNMAPVTLLQGFLIMLFQGAADIRTFEPFPAGSNAILFFKKNLLLQVKPVEFHFCRGNVLLV
jgi:hypothetical protein